MAGPTAGGFHAVDGLMGSRLTGHGSVFRRVLVIEDEEILACEFVHAFEELDAEVIGPAVSFEHGLLLAETADFDCAIVDINLCGVDAYAIADALMQRAVPFAFVTGYRRSQIPDRYAHVPLIDKPIDASALARAFLQ